MAGKRLTRKQLLGNALLNYGDTQNISRVFNVTAAPIRLYAFGLSIGESADKIVINRVIQANGDNTRTDCGDLVAVGNLFEQPYKVGCHAVELNADVTEVVIDASGAYQLIYVGDNRENVYADMIIEGITTVNDTTRGITCNGGGDENNL